MRILKKQGGAQGVNTILLARHFAPTVSNIYLFFSTGDKYIFFHTKSAKKPYSSVPIVHIIKPLPKAHVQKCDSYVVKNAWV